jgi:hypothetical protein
VPQTISEQHHSALPHEQVIRYELARTMLRRISESYDPLAEDTLFWFASCWQTSSGYLETGWCQQALLR